MRGTSAAAGRALVVVVLLLLLLVVVVEGILALVLDDRRHRRALECRPGAAATGAAATGAAATGAAATGAAATGAGPPDDASEGAGQLAGALGRAVHDEEVHEAHRVGTRGRELLCDRYARRGAAAAVRIGRSAAASARGRAADARRRAAAARRHVQAGRREEQPRDAREGVEQCEPPVSRVGRLAHAQARRAQQHRRLEDEGAVGRGAGRPASARELGHLGRLEARGRIRRADEPRERRRRSARHVASRRRRKVRLWVGGVGRRRTECHEGVHLRRKQSGAIRSNQSAACT